MAVNQTGYVADPGSETPVTAQEKWGQALLGLQKEGLQRDMQTYDNTVKAMMVNPINAIGEKNITDQAKMISAYQQDYAQTAQKYKGDLPLGEQVRLNQVRNNLAQWQEQKQNEYQMYLSDNKAVKMNPEKYDLEDFKKAQDNYLKTGSYPIDALTPARISLPKWSQGLKTGVSEQINENIKQYGNTQIGTTITSMAKDPVRQSWAVQVMSDHRAASTLSKEFNDLPVNQKNQYLKQYGDQLSAELNYGADKYSNYMEGAAGKTKTVTEPVKSTGIFSLGGTGINALQDNPDQSIKDQQTGKTPHFSHYYEIGQLGLGAGGSVLNDIKTVGGENPNNASLAEKGISYFPIAIAQTPSGENVILLKKGMMDKDGKPTDLGNQIYSVDLIKHRNLISHKIQLPNNIGTSTTNNNKVGFKQKVNGSNSN